MVPAPKGRRVLDGAGLVVAKIEARWRPSARRASSTGVLRLRRAATGRLLDLIASRSDSIGGGPTEPGPSVFAGRRHPRQAWYFESTVDLELRHRRDRGRSDAFAAGIVGHR
jgi:hypothetical protein